jgi:uncharacterized protein YutE (UPF0331/DUF86 family)
MYFVDRQKIENILRFLEKQLSVYRTYQDWEDVRSMLALERIVQTSMDSVLDVGNDLIDGFIMRDPGSYEDIVDILLDEKVITESMSLQFKKLLPLRKMLVQDYLDLTHEELSTAFKENYEAFAAYPEAVRQYIQHELGPVSAFKN